MPQRDSQQAAVTDGTHRDHAPAHAARSCYIKPIRNQTSPVSDRCVARG
jgi:hypothetical protein